MSFIEKKNVSFLLQTDKIIIDPKSISRLKTNKKRFQPATCFNKKTAALRVFELESIDGFEKYSTTSKGYAVLKVQYFEALVTFLAAPDLCKF